MKKKMITICLALCLAATAVIGGTLAYFTDKDSAVNTFTVGSVDIRILESTLHRDNDSATNDQIIADASDYADYLAVEGNNIMPGQWVKKAPYIQNVGKNDAYVRTRIRFEKDEASSLYIMEYTTAQDAGKIVKSMALLDATGAKIKDVADYDEVKNATENWVYLEYTYTYTDILPAAQAGDTSVTYYAPVWQFSVKNHLDQDDIENLEIDKITVYADAIQAEGFDTAADAFQAFDMQ